VSPRRRSLGSPQTWLSLAAVLTFVYGVESWRSRASKRATRAEQARFRAAVICLLGADGVPLAYRPSEARRRLRALAMSTPLTPTPTWIDRCVPLLRDLAVRGAEVDATRDLRAAPTAVARHARELALLTARVGLVWQVRAGDPGVDMDRIADALVRTATEIDLAAVVPTRESMKGPQAPAVVPLPRFTSLPFGTLFPLPVGTPGRFLAGAPLPLLSVVWVRDGVLHIEPVASDDARWWRVVPGGIVRIVADDVSRDGLSMVHFDTLLGPRATGRIAAPPPEVNPRAVALDATVSGHALWLAEAVRGRTPVLARLPLADARGEAATAARLGPPLAEAEVHRAHVDEEVAVVTAGRQVVAAYTEHLDATGLVAVRMVRAEGGERALVHPVVPVGRPWMFQTARVGLALCPAQGATWFFVASLREWRVGVVREGALYPVARTAHDDGRLWDDALTVRCTPQGVLAYGRVHPRRSPVWRCLVESEGPRCDLLPPLDVPQPIDLNPWTTRTLRGTAHVHAEWPLGFALTREGTVVALRAAGTIAAVSRLPRGAVRWEPERVLYDAAAEETRRTVYSAEVYADSDHVLVAVSDESRLAVIRSADDGLSWQAP